MADFLDGCNDQHIPPSEFIDIFCKRCRNRDCMRAGWAADKFSARVMTQEERLFNPQQADPRLPKYAQILASEFQDMLKQAMVLEISSKRGDWEIPQIPIVGGTPEATATEMLAQIQVPDQPPSPPPPSPAAAPSPVAAPRPVGTAAPVLLSRGNTDVPAGGIMVDGGAIPQPATPVVDPWAPKTDRVIPVGGKVQMGGSKESK